MGKRNGQKGFTLIEIVTVLVIMAILAAVTIPSMTNFITRSRQSARNNNARTIFMVAQSALTSKYAQGDAFKDSIKLLSSNKVDIRSIDGISQKEKSLNGDNIYYLSVNGGGEAGNVLLSLIGFYINDKEILNNTILIEFNVENGNVLSAFYSERASSFGYRSGGYDVTRRGKTALEEGFVGYYAVDTTGKVVRPTPPGEPTITLVDYTDGNMLGKYGLLTAECVLPATRLDTYIYELALEPQVRRGQSDDRVTISNSDTAVTDIRFRDLPDNLADAMTNPSVTLNGRRIAVYKEVRTASETALIFVLDSAVSGMGFADAFPSVGCGYLSATFSVSDGVDSSTAVSNLVHAYYGGNVENATRDTFYVGSVRHLNNMRYLPGGHFLQGDANGAYSIPAYGFDGGELNLTPVCNDPAEPFAGSYSGRGSSITHLISRGGDNGGLFGYIRSGATVSSLTITADAKILGKVYAGGIACVNDGTIRSCTVQGSIRSDVSDGATGGIAGGLAGVNNGEIKLCYGGAFVSGGASAGGVAGENGGSIDYCETGTASKNNAIVAGARPYFGNFGKPAVYKPGNLYVVANNNYKVEVGEKYGAAGGIAGRVTGGGRIQRCVNAIQVEAGELVKNAGGIAGVVDSASSTNVAVKYCYNAGAVFGAGVAGGVVGALQCGKIDACYNSACVNIITKRAADDRNLYYVFERKNQNTEIGGVNQFGGIVGYGSDKATVTNCYSANYAGDECGGAFGVMENSTIAHCAFLANVYNTAGTYRDSETHTSSVTDAGVTRVTAEQMRILHFTLFEPNTLNQGKQDGVGDFGYQLPYLSFNDSDCDLAEKFHRTPYEKPVQEYGRVTLTNYGNDGEILMTFLMNPKPGDSNVADPMLADLYLTSNDGFASEGQLYLGLRLSNFNNLNEARQNGVHATLSGAQVNPASTREVKVEGYSDTNLTAEEKELGYTHRYYLIFRWEESGNSKNHLPPDANNVFAEFFEPGKVTSAYRYALSNTLQRFASGYLTISDSQPFISNQCAMIMDIPGIGNGDLTLNIVYADGQNPGVIRITASNFANAKNYNQAVSDPNSYIQFNGGGGGAGTAVIFKHGNKYQLILYSNTSGDIWYRPNSFRTNVNFTIQATLGGRTYVSNAHMVTP